MFGRLGGHLDFAAADDGRALPLSSVFVPEGYDESLAALESTNPAFRSHRTLALELLVHELAKRGWPRHG